jgi:hypothetical protein
MWAVTAVGAVLILLVLGESACRLNHRPDNPPGSAPYTIPPQYVTPGLSNGGQDNFAEMVFSPVLTYRPKENHQGRGYKINRQGFRRQTDLASPKGADTVRIFVLGGSFAFGAGVPDGYTYSEVMESQLQKRFPRQHIEVVNAGVGGYTSLQEYLLLATRVVRYEPDFVIFLTLANDALFSSKGQDILDGNDALDYEGAIKACLNQRVVPRIYHGQVFYDPDEPYPPLWEDYHFKLLWTIDQALFRLKGKIAKKVVFQPLPAKVAARRFCYIHDLKKVWCQLEQMPMLTFLQPIISSTKKPLHPEERAIWERLKEENNRVFSELYGAVRQQLATDLNHSIFDINDEMRLLGPDTCAFVDWVHFGEVGQKWLGEYLAEKAAPVVAQRLEQRGLAANSPIK